MLVPTKGGSSKWQIQHLLFQTTDGVLGENENCTAVSGYWYDYPQPAAGPKNAFREIGSWVGVQDGNRELWVGIQCTTEQAELLSVTYQETKPYCDYFPTDDGPLPVTAFLGLWSSSEWLEV